MGITDNYLAYQFDRVVEIYGRRVDDLLKETKEVKAAKPAAKKGYYVQKPKYTLEKALKEASQPGKSKLARANSDFLLMMESGRNSMVD
jgi:hypothetical protein